MATQEPARVEVDDVVVLLLGAPASVKSLRNRIEGVTRLEKLFFLLQHETGLGEIMTEDPSFRPDNFGPFSAKIYQAVETLAAASLIEDTARPSQTSDDTWEEKEVIGAEVATPFETRDFSLTERGCRYYRALLKELPDSTEAMLAEFKERFASLPLRQLIRYVYKNYPKYTEKSLIRDEILDD